MGVIDEDGDKHVVGVVMAGGGRLGADAAERVARSMTTDAALVDEYSDTLTGQAAGTDHLELRVGQWRIDLGKEAGRALFLSSIAALALADRGVTELGIAVVTAVLPSVLNVERVRVGAGDRRLLLELRLLPHVRDRSLTGEELYAQLPEEVRREISSYDFADFVERVRDAGYVTTADDGTVWVDDPDCPGFSISWR